jgi:hypothetical protein
VSRAELSVQPVWFAVELIVVVGDENDGFAVVDAELDAGPALELGPVLGPEPVLVDVDAVVVAAAVVAVVVAAVVGFEVAAVVVTAVAAESAIDGLGAVVLLFAEAESELVVGAAVSEEWCDLTEFQCAPGLEKVQIFGAQTFEEPQFFRPLWRGDISRASQGRTFENTPWGIEDI